MSVTHSNGNSKRVCVGVSVCESMCVKRHLTSYSTNQVCIPLQTEAICFCHVCDTKWTELELRASLSLFSIFRLQLQHQGGGWWRKCTGFMYRIPSSHPINTSGTHVWCRDVFFSKCFRGKQNPRKSNRLISSLAGIERKG